MYDKIYVKLLGIHTDKHLTQTKHIIVINSKIFRAIFLINRVKYIFPHKSIKPLYYTLIHIHIAYGIQICDNSNKLDIFRKRALKQFI